MMDPEKIQELREAWRQFNLVDERGSEERLLSDEELVEATWRKVMAFGRAMAPIVAAIQDTIENIGRNFTRAMQDQKVNVETSVNIDGGVLPTNYPVHLHHRGMQ